MASYPEELVPGCISDQSLEYKPGEVHPKREAPFDNHIFGRLGELLANISSAAEVVKQVQGEVWWLRQENETLRRKLSPVEFSADAKGDQPALRSSAGFGSTCLVRNYDKPRAPVLEPAVVVFDEPELEHVLPFSIEEDLNVAEFEPPSDVVRVSFLTVPDNHHPKADKSPDVGFSVQGVRSHQLAARPQSRNTSADSDENKSAEIALQQSRKFLHQTSSVADGDENNLARKVSQVSHTLLHQTKKQQDHGRNVVRGLFFDQDVVKETLKKNIAKPEFNVARLYHTEGYAQWIVRSHNFENISLTVIAANVIWIAVDTEHNQSDLLVNADVGFQVVEHMFCVFFVFEVLVRLAAFEVKRNCMQSGWFVFDAALVMIMVIEDWILTVVLLAGAGAAGGTGKSVSLIKNTAILRGLRLLRLARLGRCLKLMRQSPEVMIMVKAMWGSMRCVIWTCVLLAAVMFGFGVCFTSLCKGTSLEDMHFPSLTGSLHTLMIAGLFPDLEDISKSINGESLFFWLIFVFYLTVTTVCILNLVIGVLVEIVKTSSLVQRDAMDVLYVKQTLLKVLDLMEQDNLTHIYVSKEEFEGLLHNTHFLEVLINVGIDVIGLVDLVDFIFIEGALSFADLLEIVLQLRSSADVTVKDVVEVRKFLTYEINILKLELQRIGKAVAVRENSAVADQHSLRKFSLRRRQVDV